jgi:Mor family transcriptional regulator
LQALVLELTIGEFDEEGVDSDLEQQITKLKEKMEQFSGGGEFYESISEELNNFVSFVKRK